MANFNSNQTLMLEKMIQQHKTLENITQQYSPLEKMTQQAEKSPFQD